MISLFCPATTALPHAPSVPPPPPALPRPGCSAVRQTPSTWSASMPKKSKPDHPTYAEMIAKAIVTLKEVREVVAGCAGLGLPRKRRIRAQGLADCIIMDVGKHYRALHELSWATLGAATAAVAAAATAAAQFDAACQTRERLPHARSTQTVLGEPRNNRSLSMQAGPAPLLSCPAACALEHDHAHELISTAHTSWFRGSG